jgi:hypothetical protein
VKRWIARDGSAHLTRSAAILHSRQLAAEGPRPEQLQRSAPITDRKIGVALTKSSADFEQSTTPSGVAGRSPSETTPALAIEEKDMTMIDNQAVREMVRAHRDRLDHAARLRKAVTIDSNGIAIDGKPLRGAHPALTSQQGSTTDPMSEFAKSLREARSRPFLPGFAYGTPQR